MSPSLCWSSFVNTEELKKYTREWTIFKSQKYFDIFIVSTDLILWLQAELEPITCFKLLKLISYIFSFIVDHSNLLIISLLLFCLIFGNLILPAVKLFLYPFTALICRTTMAVTYIDVVHPYCSERFGTRTVVYIRLTSNLENAPILNFSDLFCTCNPIFFSCSIYGYVNIKLVWCMVIKYAD